MNKPNYFSRDHIVRDSNNRPIGRAVLKEDFLPYQDLKVVVLKVPLSKISSRSVLGMTVYINEEPYMIPKDLPISKVSSSSLDHRVGLFVLKYIGEKDNDD